MKPILFNTEMVKAILDGRKTQFRKHTGNYIAEDGRYEGFRNKDVELVNGIIEIHTTLARKISSKYKVGDVLWVREPVKVTKACNDTLKMEFEYLSDGTKKIIDIPKKYLDEYDFIKNNCFLAKLNQLHYDKAYIGVPSGCLKEMARIFLKVTNVRVERLQDIEFCDVFKEGIELIQTDGSNKACGDRNLKAFNNFVNLWNSTVKDGYKWEDNPYVFVYEFERTVKED